MQTPADEWTVQTRSQLADLVRHDETLTDTERVDRLRVLEEAKAVIAAEQVRLTVDLKTSQVQAQEEAGTPPSRLGRGVPSQVALAKRESPYLAARFVRMSEVLTADMPHTFAALSSGRLPERRAAKIVSRAEVLTPEQRRMLDESIAPFLQRWGDHDVESEITKHIHRLDPDGSGLRAEKAADIRRVTLRTAPDSMAFLTLHVPAAQGVAVHAVLTRHADAARSAGDTRAHGQVMADTAIERLTGQADAAAVPCAVDLVMSDQTMLNHGEHADEPAELVGYGPVPAEVARRLLLAADAEADVWVRRLFAHPGSGQLVRIESRARLFRGALRRLVVARDLRCRTPWCGARIRQVDHVVEDADGGVTSSLNGEGLCEACNYAKAAPGWSAFPVDSHDGGQHTVQITTPTGHRYRSRPPDPPRTHSRRPRPVVQIRRMPGLRVEVDMPELRRRR